MTSSMQILIPCRKPQAHVHMYMLKQIHVQRVQKQDA